MNRVQVVEELASVTNLTVSQVPGDVEVKVRPDEFRLHGDVFGPSGLPFSREGVLRLLGYTGVNPTFAGKLTGGTLSRVVTELLNFKETFNVVHTDNEIRDLLPAARIQLMSLDTVLDSLEAGLPKHDINRVLLLPNYVVQLEATTYDEVAIREGDYLRAGVMTRFSTLGLVDPVVQAYTYRLVCLNGMTSFKVFNEFNLGHGSQGELATWLARSAAEAYEGFPLIVDQLRELMYHDMPPADRSLVLTGLLKQARLPAEIKEIIFAKAIEEPPTTMFDVLQLLTWATSNVITDPVQVVRGQRAAASFVEESLHPLHCPTCNRQV